MVSIGARLREERDRLGLNQTDFATLAGQSKKSQVRYEADERSPDGQYLAAIAEAGADVLYVLTGHRVSQPAATALGFGGAELEAKAALERVQLGTPVLDAMAKAHGLPAVPTLPFDSDDFAVVHQYDALLSAGPGSVNDNDIPSGAVAFRRDWLKRTGISPGDAMVLSVKGDSMAPTLCDGDLVMVDRRKTVPVGRRIYALVGPDGEARVKRVERLPAALLLQSDNENYPTEMISPDDADRVRILGEVVWWGHTVRE